MGLQKCQSWSIGGNFDSLEFSKIQIFGFSKLTKNYNFDTFEKNCLDWENCITPNLQFSFSSNLRDFQIITSQFFVTKFTFIWHPLSKSLQHIKMTVLEHCHTKMVKIWLLIFRNALFFFFAVSYVCVWNYRVLLVPPFGRGWFLWYHAGWFHMHSFSQHDNNKAHPNTVFKIYLVTAIAAERKLYVTLALVLLLPIQAISAH